MHCNTLPGDKRAPNRIALNARNQTNNKLDPEAFTMNDVKVFALSTCIHCRNAKKYLDECDVKYDCVHVDQLIGDERNDTMRELRGLNPAVSFPTIVIKGKVIVGYHKDKIDAALEGE